MMRNRMRRALVGSLVGVALPLTGLAVLTETPSASADAVIGSVIDLGEHDVDVNGTPSPTIFWNASFGSRYLFMTGAVPGSPTPRELTAVDTATGQYVGTWALQYQSEPNDSLVTDGDTVWVSSAYSGVTQLFEVGQNDAIADFPNTIAVAVVQGRAYLFGDGTHAPALTVLDDDASSPGYLSPVSTPTPPSTLEAPIAVTAGGDRLFVNDGASVIAVNADATSPAYLTTTGTAPAPSADIWLATDAGGDRLLSWGSGGTVTVYGDDGGRLVADGTFDPCASACDGILAALSPDGRRTYVTTGDVMDEVRVYDATAPAHPELTAIEAFAGARTSALALSPDGTQLTTGGQDPKIATVTGFASTPTITGPKVPVPGDALTVDPGDWSTTPTWQWLRNGQPIGGTTDATTYTVTKADLGATLTVRAAADGLATRTSAPVTVPTAPRLAVTVTGQRSAGWYRGQAVVRFACTPGTGRIPRCPAAVTLRSGTNHQVRRTITDQYGLTSSVVSPRIDVCSRCVTGATHAGGRWVVRHGQLYAVAIVGGDRPRSVALARVGRTARFTPVTVRRGEAVAGRTVWLFRLTAPAGRGQWTLRYRHGGQTSQIPLTVH